MIVGVVSSETKENVLSNNSKHCLNKTLHQVNQ